MDTPKRIALAGATGLIGAVLLDRLLNEPLLEHVYAPTRRPLAPHPRLSNPVGEFAQMLGTLDPPLDTAFCCLGTTMAQAGSEEAFYNVDYTLVKAFSERAKALGVRHFLVVSALGANSQSRFFYNRVKGQMQEMLISQGFEQLTIAQPSLLLGKRAQVRTAEHLSAPLAKLLPGNYKAIPATTVAHALWRLALEAGKGVRIVKSKELAALGRH